jgi:hypothetical protein
MEFYHHRKAFFLASKIMHPVTPDEQMAPFRPFYMHPGCHGIPCSVHECAAGRAWQRQ